MKYIFIAMLQIFCVFSTIRAQEITLEKTLSYINTKLKGYCTFEIKDKLVIKIFENGKEVRQDEVFIDDLDANSIKYSPDDKFISFRCKESKKSCFTRRVYINESKQFYPRISLLVDKADEKTINGLQKALKCMILLSQDPDFKSYESFE